MKIPDYSKFSDALLHHALAICKLHLNCTYGTNTEITLATYKYYSDCIRAIREEQRKRK